jgi:hypothetical protein
MTAIIEAAARQALLEAYGYPMAPEHADRISHAVLAAVTPLIRAQALEEAAKVAENHIFYSTNFGPPLKQLEEQIAAALRALKDQP